MRTQENFKHNTSTCDAVTSILYGRSVKLEAQMPHLYQEELCSPIDGSLQFHFHLSNKL